MTSSTKTKRRTKKSPAMETIKVRPAQCPSCGGKVLKRGGAYKKYDCQAMGVHVEWFYGACKECGQKVRLRVTKAPKSSGSENE